MRSLMRLVKEKDPILSKDLVSVLTMFCPVLCPVLWWYVLLPHYCLTGEERSGANLFWVPLDHPAPVSRVSIARY